MWNLNERRRRGSYVAKVRKKEMERVKKKTNLINNQVNPSNEWICILQQCELNSIHPSILRFNSEAWHQSSPSSTKTPPLHLLFTSNPVPSKDPFFDQVKWSSISATKTNYPNNQARNPTIQQKSIIEVRTLWEPLWLFQNKPKYPIPLPT